MTGDRAYNYKHVNAMNDMILRNIAGVRTPVRVICVTDEVGGIECDTFPLWRDGSHLVNATKPTLPSCYRRLRLYDGETQRSMDIDPGDRIVSLDLDTVICGSIRQILQTEGRFVGWMLAGTYHPLVYNGSFQMFTAGDLQEIWSEFDPETSPMAAQHAGYLGSDQSWLSWKLIGKEGSVGIDFPVFASYPLHCRAMHSFSAQHRLVFFHGKKKPWSPAANAESKWIQRYWRE